MRTIKFRTWTGEMEYDITVGKFGTFYVNPGEKGDGLDINDTSSLTPFTTKLVGCPLMQFTGLLDKNGKEIYEGDIIFSRFMRSDGKCWLERQFVVTFEDFSFRKDYTKSPYRIDKSLGKILLDDGKLSKTYEIIGNIYENPELLTK